MSIEKPKVLILGPLPPPVMGPSVATQIILDSALNEYFELYHLDTNVHTDLSTLGRWSWIRVVRNIYIYSRMVSLILRHRPRLVLVPISQTTRGFIKDSFYILIGGLLFRKILVQLRGGGFRNWIKGSSRLMQLYVTIVLGMAAGAIVLGRKLTNLFQDYFSDENVFVVPNGADYEFSPSDRVMKQKMTVLYLGHLQRSKGIIDALEAVLLLHSESRLPDFVLKMTGGWLDRETESECRALVDAHGLPAVFYPHAGHDQKRAFLLDADMLLFTPREPEGHPWVIVEAMAAGLPIIATDQGAITESVLDGINGFIVETRNPRQIAEKISLLLENRELREGMGIESRKIYEERFTEEKMVQHFTECFNRILHG